MVAGIIQKRLTYSSSIYRIMEKQYFALRSKVFAATFDKAHASYDTAIALVLPGHQLDYKFAAIYAALYSWERFFASGGLTDLLRYWPPPSQITGTGLLSLLLTDLSFLEWQLDTQQSTVNDAAGTFYWKLGFAHKGSLQHAIRAAGRCAVLRRLLRNLLRGMARPPLILKLPLSSIENGRRALLVSAGPYPYQRALHPLPPLENEQA